MNIKSKIKSLYIDADFIYLLKNGKFKLTFEVFVFIGGFFILWCFGNYTLPILYGTYIFIKSVISFFEFFSFIGIRQSLTQTVANGYDNFLITSTVKSFKFSLLGVLATIMAAFIYTYLVEYNIIIFICLIIGGIFFPFNHSLISYQYYLSGKGKFKKDLIYRTIILIIDYTLLLSLIFLVQNLIIYFLLTYGIQLIFNLIFFRSCIKQIDKNKKSYIKEKEAIKYGYFLTKYDILTITCLYINNLIIGLIYGPIQLAFYVIGTKLITSLAGFIKPSFSVLLTKYSQKDSKLSKKFVYIIIFFSIGLFSLVVLALPYFLRIFFPTYIDSLKYGIFYSFILLIIPIVILFGYYFRGKVEKRIIRNVRTIPDITSLILIFPFLLWLGIYGLILIDILRYLLRLIIYILNIDTIEFK